MLERLFFCLFWIVNLNTFLIKLCCIPNDDIRGRKGNNIDDAINIDQFFCLGSL